MRRMGRPGDVGEVRICRLDPLDRALRTFEYGPVVARVALVEAELDAEAELVVVPPAGWRVWGRWRRAWWCRRRGLR